MFQHLKDHDKYLYHYTSAQKALDHILKNRTLMFNSLRNTNDPKESKNWKFDFHLAKGQSVTSEESEQIWRDVSNEVKIKCKVLCFSMDKSGLGENYLNDIFLRGFSMPRMWAQYGDKHKGVCLIFNKQNIEKKIIEQFGENADLYGSNIKYRNAMLKGDIFNSPYTLHYNFLKEVGLYDFVRSYVEKYNNELFFEKSLDWRDENEHRYLMHINSDDNQFLDFGNALEGIVFGTDTSEDDQRDIFQIAVQGETQFEQITYVNSTPWFSFKDFRIYHKHRQSLKS